MGSSTLTLEELDNLMLTSADPPQAVVIDWGFAEPLAVQPCASANCPGIVVLPAGTLISLTLCRPPGN